MYETWVPQRGNLPWGRVARKDFTVGKLSLGNSPTNNLQADFYLCDFVPGSDGGESSRCHFSSNLSSS